MRKADLYIRVSTDEQADKGYSQRDQEDRLRKYCEIKGISVRDVYIEDHSAKSFKRPEWQKYLSNLRKTKNNKAGSIILFTKWDRFSRNNFWVAVRNPLYCGKIFIPPYKEEKGYFVKGQHEPLISEKTFADVQDILDGRKRVVKPKIVAMDNLPLRGFLKCPKCDRMLTGSASKGKMGNYYYYYHCSSACGTRFKAETVNEAFVKQLRHLTPVQNKI